MHYKSKLKPLTNKREKKNANQLQFSERDSFLRLNNFILFQPKCDFEE